MNTFPEWRERIQGIYRAADAIVGSTRFDPNARSQFVGRVRALLMDLEMPGKMPKARDDRRESLVAAIQLLKDTSDGAHDRLVDQVKSSIKRTRDALIDPLQVTLARVYELDLVCGRCSRAITGEPRQFCETCGPLVQAEVRQQGGASEPTTKRERDMLDVLIHGKHLNDDLALCLKAASLEAPVVVGIVDMNGMKAINDAFGHSVGDDAVVVYMQAVFASFRDPGDSVYRRSDGGDELVVVFSASSPSAAVSRAVRCFERVARAAWYTGNEWRVGLTAACGLVRVSAPTNAREILDRADSEMYRAKRLSQQSQPSRSVIAIDGSEPITI